MFVRQSSADMDFELERGPIDELGGTGSELASLLKALDPPGVINCLRASIKGNSPEARLARSELDHLSRTFSQGNFNK